MLTTATLDAFRKESSDIRNAVRAKGDPEKIKKGIAALAARTQSTHSEVADRPGITEVRDFEDVLFGHHEKDELVGFQKAVDDFVLVHSILGNVRLLNKDEDNPVWQVSPAAVNSRLYHQLRKGFPKLCEQGAKVVKASRVAKAAMYSTGTAVGDEWVPTETSSKLHEVVRLEAGVASLFDVTRMPSNPYQAPIDGTLPLMKILTEATTNSASQFTSVSQATGKLTLTAKKAGFQIPISEELNEDSIIPVLPKIRALITKAMAHGLDSALINGDTTEPHQDSDVDSSTHADKLWTGLRKYAPAAMQFDGATFALSLFRNARATGAKYMANPKDLAIITSVAGAMRILGLTQVETAEKYGANASILRGEIDKLDNIPIVVSEDCRQNLNASGVYDGTTTTKTVIVIVNRTAWTLGERRGVTVKVFNDSRVDQDKINVSARWDFGSWEGSGKNHTAFLYNVADTV